MESSIKPSLKKYNTFGIDAHCDELIEIKSIDQIHDLVSQGRFNEKHLILGGGSNLLFSKNFEGLVLLNQLKGIEILSENDQYVDLKVASGENWHDFVVYTVDRNWGGVENLSLIPGTVGAAPIQNIGAYGCEIGDTLTRVQFVNLKSNKLEEYSNKKCDFGYRDSIFKRSLKGDVFICSITVRLNKNPELNLTYGNIQGYLFSNNILRPKLKDVSEAVIAIRRSKLPDPQVLGNSGSFFKNPIVKFELVSRLLENYPDLKHFPAGNNYRKVAAGWLIEQCGWKGKIVGKVGAHKDQALCLVNYGGATGQEVIDLAQQIIQSVKDKFDITLEPEVNIL